ncbi:MAG: hypothetical protein ONB05_12265, partial [candidate division KSB1 bacterium]|nr:hypothetical protein [candidate division KSB1 bacterium]
MILLTSVAILLQIILIIGPVQATGRLGSQQLSQQTRTPEQSLFFDVQHYKIELQFNEQEKSFTGKVTISLIPLENNFTSFELDAVDMRIEDVTGVPLTFQADSQKVSITLKKAYSLN